MRPTCAPPIASSPGFVHSLDEPGTHPPFRHRSEALYLAASAQPIEETKVPPVVFAQEVRKRRPGPKGPNQESLIDAVVAMKRRNPVGVVLALPSRSALAFGIEIDKDVVQAVS